MTRKTALATAIALLGTCVFATGCAVESAQAQPEGDKKKTALLSENEPLKEEEETSEKKILVPLSPSVGSSEIQVSGTALAVRESYLSAEVPGIVEKIAVERGDRVKKNQVLLSLDNKGYKLGVAQAKAALDAAKAQEEQLRTEIDRVKELLRSGAAPTATLDQLSAQNKGAGANVRMSEAALKRAKKSLADSQVRAPYNGVITEILKQVGENAPSMPPTMLLKIVDTSSLEVQAYIPEEAGADLLEGDTAKVRIDSANIETEGDIVFVSNSIAPQTRTFEVRIEIDNPDGKIKAGSFARVTIPSSSAETDR